MSRLAHGWLIESPGLRIAIRCDSDGSVWQFIPTLMGDPWRFGTIVRTVLTRHLGHVAEIQSKHGRWKAFVADPPDNPDLLRLVQIVAPSRPGKLPVAKTSLTLRGRYLKISVDLGKTGNLWQETDEHALNVIGRRFVHALPEQPYRLSIHATSILTTWWQRCQVSMHRDIVPRAISDEFTLLFSSWKRFFETCEEIVWCSDEIVPPIVRHLPVGGVLAHAAPSRWRGRDDPLLGFHRRYPDIRIRCVQEWSQAAAVLDDAAILMQPKMAVSIGPNEAFLTVHQTPVVSVIDVDSGTVPLNHGRSIIRVNQAVARWIPTIVLGRDLQGLIMIDFIGSGASALSGLTPAVRKGFKARLKSSDETVSVMGLTRSGLLEITRSIHRLPLCEAVARPEYGVLTALRDMLLGYGGDVPDRLGWPPRLVLPATQWLIAKGEVASVVRSVESIIGATIDLQQT